MRDGRSSRGDPKAALIAGLAAGTAYVATMEFDNRLSGINQDDLALVGRPLVEGPDHARTVGLPIHVFNSVSLALVYAALAHDRFPGPPWFRGALFAMLEDTVLYPLALLERYHPGIRNGEIDRYWNWSAYLLSIPRHVAYGAVLGSLYERLRVA